MNLILTMLKISLIEMIYLTGVVLTGGLILGLFERLSNEFMLKSFGRRGILITAWLGTPIHELGHAVMCLIFNHKITRMKLLDVRFENGVLGYVEHSYNKNNVYERVGNIFIGLGPVFSGTTALIFGLYFLLPHSFNTFKAYLVSGITSSKIDSNLLTTLMSAGGTLLKSIFAINNLSSINFWLFLYLALCISSHIALSRADMRGAWDGLWVLFVLIFVMNLILRYFSINTEHYIIKLGTYNAHLIAFLMIALIFSAFTMVVNFLFYIALGKGR